MKPQLNPKITLPVLAALATVSCAGAISSSIPVQVAPVALPVAVAQGSIADMEQAVHQQVNQYRAQKGLPPLSLNQTISQQCREHSQNMANGSVPFSHNGFDVRVDAIAEEITYGSAAENVAYNYGHPDPVRQAVTGWIGSDGHRKNMEGDFDLTGVGVAKNAKGEYYFTQIFIKRR
ncbi:CAP domain-containing protein [[Phormidium] sp. ETS-05]|uniref:CAP domain-containing protein n=1 Tax=[Phormidium] sp. ETS-05 TaxID=222819 RepID=UPI001E320175|nr:CAP domain-containing protein [[Phormidium] sp. ETS-05]